MKNYLSKIQHKSNAICRYSRQAAVLWRQVAVLLLCLSALIVSPAISQPNCTLSGTLNTNDRDVDNDDDGLIEICRLEGLYAIRHQPDGTGYRATNDEMKDTEGCGGGDDNDSCIGYELMRDLDFEDDYEQLLGHRK